MATLNRIQNNKQKTICIANIFEAVLLHSTCASRAYSYAQKLYPGYIEISCNLFTFKNRFRVKFF